LRAAFFVEDFIKKNQSRNILKDFLTLASELLNKLNLNQL